MLDDAIVRTHELATGYTAPRAMDMNCLDSVPRRRKTKVLDHGKVALENWPGLYHKFQVDDLVKPDLCVCFHPGFQEGIASRLMWSPTIDWIIEHDIPLLVTEYDEGDIVKSKMVLDMMMMRKLRALRYVQEPLANPWASNFNKTLPYDANCIFSSNNQYMKLIVEGFDNSHQSVDT